ncbi:MAG: C10 family peptidase [Prevotella sp.]|nr:C10 family peptidase [Prevotella sp.]
MMKKFYSLIIALFVALTMNAGEVTELQALQKAQQFMKGKKFKQTNLRRATSTAGNAYYVFNAENNGGFVIVAGDDRMTEILGYSEKGNVNLDSIPEQMKWLLDGYQTIYRKLSTSIDNTPKARRTTRANVEPLLSTMWGQENPYNEMCPMYGTNRSITGCVATAMAQVINYCRWPEGQTASVPAYTTETYQISVPALEPTQFNWEYMGIKQVARLMCYCGQSVKMDYGLAASGAALNLVPDALINVFGYSESARCVSCSSEYSDDEWESLLYEEIAAKRAVILSGVDSSRGGHAFVAHGYKDGLFCINWGWNGQQDGYFALTNLASAGGDYSLYQNAVIGIQPPGGIPITSRSIIKVSTDIFDWNTEWRTIYYQKNDDGSFPSFSVKEKIINTKQESIGVSIGYGLYGDQGLVEVLQQESHSFQADETYWHNATLAISNSVGDGEYYIVPISKDERATEWLPDIGSTSAFVKVIISGNLLKLTNYPLTSNEQREEYGIHTIDGITFELFNQMGSFRATVLPHKDGKYSGSITVPDEIEYDGIVFKVYNSCDISFKDCPELTSLSTSMIYGPSIVNCVKLSNLELREGVVEFDYDGIISGCPLLQSIEYPSTTTRVYHAPSACESLKVIKFRNPVKVEFGFSIYESSSLPSLTDIYFYSGEPPTLRWGDEGYTVTSEATIHIPIGTMSSYKNSILKNCKLVEDLDTPFTGVNWSYCISDKSTDVFAEHCNNMNRNNIEFALHVPAEMISPYKNQRITSIQYYTPFNYTTDAPSYVFITKPGTDYLVKQATTETIEKQWTNVKLQEPLTITGDELYIGVGQVGHFCVYFTDPDVKEMDGIWMREMGPDRNGWLDLNPGKWWNQAERIPNWTHPIAVRFVIEGENFPNDLKICNVLGAEQDGKQVVKATIVNRSPELVKTYSINWTIDGKETGTKTVETSLIPNGHEEMILDLPSSVIATRSHVIKFEVTAINGKEDGVPANSNIEYSFSLPVSTTFSRRVVMEEVSGTWCGWTPVSIEAMKQMKNRYPDNFIAIAVHCDGENVSGTDQMANADNYLPILKKVQTIPGSLISRATSKYPNLPEVEAFANENKSNAVATMNLSVSTEAEDASKVMVKTDTRFGFNDEVEGRYRYAYVVLEDGVGPYVQSNAYSNQPEMSAPDDYLNVWTKLGDKVEMLHDNVARGIYPDINGVNGSVPASIKKGQSYNYEYTLTLPTNIQNKDNVRIAALLIDCWTGEIINAADCKIGESSKNIEIVPITETEEISFKDSMNDNTDLSNTVIDNTYFTVNAANGDGYDATEQALVLNSTTSSTQMSAIQGAQVGDASVRENFSGIIFELPAGKGVITVDAKTIGTHVLNVQIGNGAPTQVKKSERGTAEVEYNVSAPTYVYLYASTESGASARLYRGPSAGANSVLLYGYKVQVGGTGIEELKNGKMEELKYYDLNGRKVKTPKKGVYIINGKKVIVK